MNAGFAVAEGDWAYYACFSGAITRVRHDGGGRQQLTFLHRSGATTTPDIAHINVVGERIYFIGSIGNDFGIYGVDTNGNNQSLIMNFQGRQTGYMMTVAGDWIYYTDTRSNQDGGGLYKMRTDGTEREKLLDRRLFPNLRFNVVGDWIYFLGTRHVERVRIDGSGHGPVITASQDNTIAYMVISGDKIIYTDNRRTDRDHMNQQYTIHTLYSANLDGSGVQVIHNGIENIDNLNAEGNWVYFSERNQQNSEEDIARIRLDGSDKSTIVNNIRNIDGICIAGLRLYFFCDVTGTRGLYRVAVSGGTVTEL
jgi:Tol biopolymer transport system component